MNLEVVFEGEALSALRAGVRFLSGVNPQVILQALFTRETLPAVMAAERFLSRVNS